MSSPIEHVVVLMMENHSFDHMLGWLPGVGDLPPSSGTQPTKGASFTTVPCPLHALGNVLRQMYGPRGAQQPLTMDGFVFDYASGTNLGNYNPGIGPGDQDAGTQATLMGCYTPDQLPALSALATSFTTCTRWFCSVPGPTGPNRLFVNCASSGGYAGPGYLAIDGGNSYPAIPAQAATNIGNANLFQALLNVELTFAVYHEDTTFAPELILPVVANAGTNYTDPMFVTLKQNIDAGALETYTFITPQLFPHSQHASADVRDGDALIGTIYNWLRASSLWESTALVILYDEHGGHWESVGPPASVVAPDSFGWNEAAGFFDYATPEFDFTSLGPRVPAVIVSAYTPARVDDTVYEHSSVPATMTKLFGTTSLSARDQAAASFDGNFSLTAPRGDAPLSVPLPSGDGYTPPSFGQSS